MGCNIPLPNETYYYTYNTTTAPFNESVSYVKSRNKLRTAFDIGTCLKVNSYVEPDNGAINGAAQVASVESLAAEIPIEFTSEHGNPRDNDNLKVALEEHKMLMEENARADSSYELQSSYIDDLLRSYTPDVPV